VPSVIQELAPLCGPVVALPIAAPVAPTRRAWRTDTRDSAGRRGAVGAPHAVGVSHAPSGPSFIPRDGTVRVPSRGTNHQAGRRTVVRREPGYKVGQSVFPHNNSRYHAAVSALCPLSPPSAHLAHSAQSAQSAQSAHSAHPVSPKATASLAGSARERTQSVSSSSFSPISGST
jgi:hypothetical protein